MKHIIILLSLFFILSVGNSQIKLMQLQPCKVGGVLEDSCFVMTGADGILRFISLSQLKGIAGGGTLTAQPDGSYTFIGENTTSIKYTCQVLQDTVIRIFNAQGTLASQCTITGTGALIKNVVVNSDTTLCFQTKSGQLGCLSMCPFVRNCETTTELTYDINTNVLSFKDEDGAINNILLNKSSIANQVNGSYEHTDEVNTTTAIGYKLQCLNDSTIQLTDWDGTVVSTCQVNGNGGSGETVTILFNNADGSYTYKNELGIDSILGYRLDGTNISNNGNFYLTDYDGTKIDSINLCYPNCPPLKAVAVNDIVSITNCDVFTGSVFNNDTLCNKGTSEFSLVQGTEINVIASIDAGGKYIVSFTNCDPNVQHKFTYRLKCADGVVSYADVIINFPNCDGATANIDMYSGIKGGVISFGIAPNDVSCVAPKLTSYKIITSTNSGSIFINDNGTGLYSPLPSFVGVDSAIIGLYCNGILCDTSFVKFTIFNGNTADDYISLCAGTQLTGLNASTNDSPCGVGITTYAWHGGIFPSTAGNFVGANPTSFSFTSMKNFCGVAHRFYIKFCDGVPVDTPTVFFYVSCGNAVADIIGAVDTLVNGNVEQNDDVCTNGGLTTWHLLSDSLAHGNSLNIPVYTCFAGCPTNTLIVGAKVQSWDTTTGKFILKLPFDFEGEACFKYRLKCKLGGTRNYDTACVSILRVVDPKMTVRTAVLDTTSSDITFTLSAKCLDGFGVPKPLENGDRIEFRIPTAAGMMSVKLIVGQNIRSGSGYTSDTLGRYASWVIPAMSPSVVILDRMALFDSTMTFKINKATFALNSNNWGDGTISGSKIGQELYAQFGVCCFSCGSGGGAIDTLPKMWSSINPMQWVEKANYNTCVNATTHLRSIVGNQAFATVPNGTANSFFSNHEWRCDTTGAFTASGVTGELTTANWWKSSTACNTCTFASGFKFIEYKTDYIPGSFYTNVSVDPLGTDFLASRCRYTFTNIGNNAQVRLALWFTKHHINSPNNQLSVLSPRIRWNATYTNNSGARESGVTIVQIEGRIAKDHGDRAYNYAQSDRVFLLTGAQIDQGSTSSVQVPGSANVWDFAHGEGYYHMHGYMLASNGKMYGYDNGQVILFSY